MPNTTFAYDTLTAMTEAEARVRGQLAGSALLRWAQVSIAALRSEGATVSRGPLDVLHGAIVDRFARASGTWTLVHATDVLATLLVHATSDAAQALVDRLCDVRDVRVETIEPEYARARLCAGARVALLPIEIAAGATRTQLRVFTFPDAVRPKRTSVRRDLLHALDAEISLVVGYSWLGLAALRTLCVGDAVALDLAAAAGAFIGVVRGGSRVLDLRVAGGAILFDGRRNGPRAPSVQLESTMNPDEIALDAIDDVEVELTFDVGTMCLSLGELATLEPGAVLMPDVGTTDRVTVRANGRAIGRGTLVRVEGTLAVRIDALAGRASETPQ